MDNYKLIESAKERATTRGETRVLTAQDVVSKIEYPSGRESYAPGFSDYHGPSRNDKAPGE